MDECLPRGSNSLTPSPPPFFPLQRAAAGHNAGSTPPLEIVGCNRISKFNLSKTRSCLLSEKKKNQRHTFSVIARCNYVNLEVLYLMQCLFVLNQNPMLIWRERFLHLR